MIAARLPDTPPEPAATPVRVVVGRAPHAETVDTDEEQELDLLLPDEGCSAFGSECLLVSDVAARVRACKGLDLPASVPAGALREIVLEAQVLVAALSEGGLVRPVAANLNEALQRLGVRL